MEKGQDFRQQLIRVMEMTGFYMVGQFADGGDRIVI